MAEAVAGHAWHMRVTVVHRPSAGGGNLEPAALRFLVAAAGHEVNYASVEDETWPAVLERPADLVVAAGGDGTVRRVLLAALDHDVATTLLPLGTANNVARTLGLPLGDPSRCVGAWAASGLRRFDVGSVLAGGDGQQQLLESAGGGVLAELVAGEGARRDDVDPEERRRRVAALWPVEHWGIEVDGVDVSGPFLGVEAMNIRELGPNIEVAPAADPGDGSFDVVLLPESTRAALVEGTPLRTSGAVALRGRVVRLRAPAGRAFHIDDQPGGTGELVLRAGPRALRVLAPESARTSR